jgi:hypothetical protein
MLPSRTSQTSFSPKLLAYIYMTVVFHMSSLIRVNVCKLVLKWCSWQFCWTSLWHQPEQYSGYCLLRIQYTVDTTVIVSTAAIEDITADFNKTTRFILHASFAKEAILSYRIVADACSKVNNY